MAFTSVISGENGGDKAGGTHARVVKGFHGGKPAFNRYGIVHILAETLVEGVYRPRNAGIRKGLYQIEVAQNEVRFGGDGKLRAAALQLFEDGAGAFVLFLARLIGVGDGADEYLLARVSFGAGQGLPIFHVDKLTPFFLVPRKPLHKAGVAVFAAVFAPHIRV